MNKLDKQYQELLQDILDNGVEKKDRTGTGTISVFGRQIRHKMSEGFPLLTTKKMAWKTMVTELLWFLRGDTNIKYLVDNDCHIWDGDAYKNYEKKVKRSIDKATEEGILRESDDYNILSKESFINRIKTDDEFAKKWGELGPIYGAQWRGWGEHLPESPQYRLAARTYVDQIQNLINDLKTNPDSRRLMVSAWNVGELAQMVLPPCHYGFQVYTRELSLLERYELMKKLDNWVSVHYKEPKTMEYMDSQNIPTRAISLMWNQRSVDTFLGLPFNIASYGLLLEIIAKAVNMVPDELIGNLGDVHLYSNHVEQAKEQIGRKLTVEERMDWWFNNRKPNRDVCDDVDTYSPYAKGVYFDSVGVPKTTREPYPLPTLVYLDEYHYLIDKELLGEISFSEKITRFRPDFFKVENYQSHPSIKAPLSN